ncbi:hypothetical protein FND50_25225 [Rhodococcus sp. WB9]|uniref:hypothetical protein n=1 Tax=Rhodococcus sp. WB9 TaxID=2594007 RepID=UPI00118706E4|nr:hypothetical protein [Rhodococcus sp. WB9]QDQ93734.1 hypothetical protein FND50_25225 [Rhodococcus sp. WB9]
MTIRDELTKLLKRAGDNGSLFVQFNEKYWGPIADAVLARYAVVELPEEHFAGDYAVTHIDGDEICIDVVWVDSPDDARKVAAALLRAADQLEKQLAEERGPDGGELDWGARADDARDAQVDRENGVTP